MILPITNRCNQKCLFCSADGRRDKTGRSHQARLLSGAKDNLVISGGEPTLSKDIFWLIKEAKKRKLFVELQTNAVTLCYESLAAKLASSGVDLFNVNFPSHSASNSDRITQTRDLFEKRLKGIRNIQKFKGEVRLTCIVNSLNYKNLEGYAVFVKENFPRIKYIQFSFIKVMGKAKKNPHILISYEEASPYLLRAFKRCRELDLDFIVDHIPLCYLGPYKKFHIDYQKIKRKEPPVDSMKEKVRIADCLQCSLSAYCCGIRRDYLQFFGAKSKVKPVK